MQSDSMVYNICTYGYHRIIPWWTQMKMTLDKILVCLLHLSNTQVKVTTHCGHLSLWTPPCEWLILGQKLPLLILTPMYNFLEKLLNFPISHVAIMQLTLIKILCRNFVFIKISSRVETDNLIFSEISYYEGWNFNSGNYLFTTDTT
jgi:hypothetical protein